MDDLSYALIVAASGILALAALHKGKNLLALMLMLVGFVGLLGLLFA